MVGWRTNSGHTDSISIKSSLDAVLTHDQKSRYQPPHQHPKTFGHMQDKLTLRLETILSREWRQQLELTQDPSQTRNESAQRAVILSRKPYQPLQG